MKKRAGLLAQMKRGAEGAISLLLILAILPLFSMMAAIVEAERYQDAVKALDEALGSSALSTLSQYDSYLLERFGLLAVKQTADEQFITSQMDKYLHLQKTTDMIGAGVATATVRAEGVYPLADTAVLRQQVTSYANILAPAAVAMDLAELDVLVKEVEKGFGTAFTETATLINSGSDLIDNSLDLYDAVEEAKSAMDSLSSEMDAYKTKYREYAATMEALQKEKEKEPTPPTPPAQTVPPVSPTPPAPPTGNEPDPDVAQEAYQEALTIYQEQMETYREALITYQEEQTAYQDAQSQYRSELQLWNERVQTLRNSATSAKNAYATSISGVESALSELEGKIKDAQEAKNEFANAGVALAADVASAKMKIEADSGSEDEKKLAKNFAEVEGSLKDAYDSTADSVNEKLSKLSTSEFESAMRAVQEEKRLAKETDASDVLSTVLANQHNGVVNQLQKFQDKSELNNLMDEMEEDAEQAGWLDMLLALFDVINSLFNTELFADGELSVTIDVNGIGGLPSGKNSPENAYEAGDDALSRRYLREIDPDYNERDPFGLDGAPTLTIFQLIINTILEIVSARQAIKDAHGIRAKWQAFKNCLNNCKNLVFQLDQVRNHFKSVQSVYERLLIMSYMAYNLPNRTNYSDGKTLTGYQYAKAALAPSVTGSNIPLIGDILSAFTPNRNYSFSGAELEYIIWGNQSELANQFGVFMEYSLYKTLAAKYRCTKGQIIDKYSVNGKFCVHFTDGKGRKKQRFFYDGGFRKKPASPWQELDFQPRQVIFQCHTYMASRLRAGICELCGKRHEQLQMHEIRSMKLLTGNDEWQRIMRDKRRKTLAVCPDCHRLIHSN